ncbi:hypothetical protein HPP92_006567 [Vanilla planifolia]|uniref:Uncharacterized protein n=1 Tax=Vanilla planifolia TaxID=51239 RepID=A0A835R9C4_VANPL|nr:hypothetical protein HPP92_006826 [Vanilla planifolia]KAG0489704.1 hypothetical protein HPP92_006567 [Vanilla planifolia]
MNPSSPSKSDAARLPSGPIVVAEPPGYPFDSAIAEDLMRITEEDNVGVGAAHGRRGDAGTVTSQVGETPADAERDKYSDERRALAEFLP